MIIRARVPVRISFGGGGTDVSPYTEQYNGCALNATIQKYAWATLELRDDKKVYIESYDFHDNVTYDSVDDVSLDGKLELQKAVILHYKKHIKTGFNLFLRTDYPPRSGLGGSASAFVAVIGVFNHLLNEDRQSSYEIAETAFNLERNVLHIKGGRQDQYAAVFGGLNFLEFKGNDWVKINPLRLPDNYMLELEKHLVLVRLPQQRGKKGDVIHDQISKAQKNDAALIDAMHETKKIAHAMKKSLLKGDFSRFGKLMHEAWQQKKRFSPLVTNESIDHLYQEAQKAGAIGGKITGAGGGGHMLFFCNANKEQFVIDALEERGCRSVDSQFDTHGLITWSI